MVATLPIGCGNDGAAVAGEGAHPDNIDPSGRIAQLARALPLQGRCRGFESLCAYRCDVAGWCYESTCWLWRAHRRANSAGARLP